MKLTAPIVYVGVGPGGGVAVGAGVGGGVTGAPSAFATLMRPKDRPAIGSVAPRICADAALLLFPLAIRSAARPAVSAGAVGMKHLHRYDTGAAEGDARHPDKVVHVRRRDPSHLGAVTVQVGGGDPADEARAQRKAADQIGLRGIDSRVENGDLRRAKDRHDPVGLVPTGLRPRHLTGVH